MVGETIAGMTRVEHAHHRVTLDFRENRGGGYAGGFGVAFDDRLLWNNYLLQTLRVDQQILRRGSESSDRPLHRPDARPVNVDRVDLLDFDECNIPIRSFFLDLFCKFLS
jgi:hypothetical protein